jgi:hypothetical protein
MNDRKLKRPQLVASRLIVEAQVYIESSRRLDKACRNSARFWGPIYFLLCHSIELALKAYLAASGVSEAKLRNELRHDIKRALRSARCHGFVPTDKRFPDIVRLLAPYHLDHSFRYPKGSGDVGVYPSVSDAAEIIAKEVGSIDTYVRRKLHETDLVSDISRS